MQARRRAEKLYPESLAAPNKVGQHTKLTWMLPQFQEFPKREKWPYGVELWWADLWCLECREKRKWQKTGGPQTRKMRGDVKSDDRKVGATKKPNKFAKNRNETPSVRKNRRRFEKK